MADLVKATDLTLRPPRITRERFKGILSERRSPARPEADAIWDLLVGGGVDPSFALGHFHVESLMGKGGYATVTKSWGNMLWDRAWTGDRPKYKPAETEHGYTYAVFDSWEQGVEYYVEYVRRYAVTEDVHTDEVSPTIDTCCSRWTGNRLGTVGNAKYVGTILHEINDIYEYVPGTYVPAGDLMIAIDTSKLTTNKRYPVKNGTALYRGTDGDVLKLANFGSTLPDGSSGGMCRFLGPVGATVKWTDPSWAWGAVVVNVKDVGERVVYIKAPKKTSVLTV